MLASICATSSLFTTYPDALADTNMTLRAILAGKSTGNIVAQDPINKDIFAVGFGKKTLLINRANQDVEAGNTDILSKAKVLENAYYGTGTMTKYQDQTSAAAPSAKITALAFNPANESLAQGREDGTVAVWNVSSIINPTFKNKVINTLKGGINKPQIFKVNGKVSSLEFDPINSKLIVTAGSTTQTFDVK